MMRCDDLFDEHFFEELREMLNLSEMNVVDNYHFSTEVRRYFQRGRPGWLNNRVPQRS